MVISKAINICLFKSMQKKTKKSNFFKIFYKLFHLKNFLLGMKFTLLIDISQSFILHKSYFLFLLFIII